jgi:hypothetical protein
VFLMNRTLALACLVGLLLTPLLWSGEKSETPDQPGSHRGVGGLIEQLGDRNFDAREAATKALDALAPEAVVPALRKAQDHADAEVRRRAAQLLPLKERAAALAPKRVDLRLKHKTLRQAVVELSKQTGYKIELWPDAQVNGDREKQVYNFDLSNVPFWEALDRVSADGGLVLQQGNWGADSLRLHFQDSHVPFVSRDGPFRIAAHGFYYSRNIDFAAVPKDTPRRGNRSESLSASFSVSVEPKVSLLGVGQARLTTAPDEKNNPMLPQQTNGVHQVTTHYYSYNGYRCYSQQFQANLAWPAKESRTVKVLKGEVPVTLLVDQRPGIVVEKVLAAKGKQLKQGDIDLDIEDVTEGPGKVYQIRMTLRNNGKDNTGDFSWHNSLYQRLEVHDAKGNKYQSRGFNWLNTTPNSVNGTFMFGEPGAGAVGPPAKLVYYTWETMQHQVPFEFRDLPLP